MRILLAVVVAAACIAGLLTSPQAWNFALRLAEVPAVSGKVLYAQIIAHFSAMPTWEANFWTFFGGMPAMIALGNYLFRKLRKSQNQSFPSPETPPPAGARKFLSHFEMKIAASFHFSISNSRDHADKNNSSGTLLGSWLNSFGGNALSEPHASYVLANSFIGHARVKQLIRNQLQRCPRKPILRPSTKDILAEALACHGRPLSFMTCGPRLILPTGAWSRLGAIAAFRLWFGEHPLAFLSDAGDRSPVGSEMSLRFAGAPTRRTNASTLAMRPFELAPISNLRIAISRPMSDGMDITSQPVLMTLTTKHLLGALRNLSALMISHRPHLFRKKSEQVVTYVDIHPPLRRSVLVLARISAIARRKFQWPGKLSPNFAWHFASGIVPG